MSNKQSQYDQMRAILIREVQDLAPLQIMGDDRGIWSQNVGTYFAPKYFAPYHKFTEFAQWCYNTVVAPAKPYCYYVSCDDHLVGYPAHYRTYHFFIIDDEYSRNKRVSNYHLPPPNDYEQIYSDDSSFMIAILNAYRHYVDAIIDAVKLEVSALPSDPQNESTTAQTTN